MLSLIIFDLDGTLLDTIDDIAFSMNYILKKHNFPTHSREAYFYFVGNGARILTERSLPEECRTEENISMVLSDFSPFYEIHKKDRTSPFDGISETLAELHRNGVKMAVASNKPHAFIPDILQYYFPPQTFSYYLGHRKGHPVKPDPEIVFDILNELKTEKGETLYVGDTSVDMQTAHAAGLRAAGALWGFRTKEELQAAEADFLLSHPRELLDLAQKL